MSLQLSLCMSATAVIYLVVPARYIVWTELRCFLRWLTSFKKVFMLIDIWHAHGRTLSFDLCYDWTRLLFGVQNTACECTTLGTTWVFPIYAGRYWEIFFMKRHQSQVTQCYLSLGYWFLVSMSRLLCMRRRGDYSCYHRMSYPEVEVVLIDLCW